MTEVLRLNFDNFHLYSVIFEGNLKDNQGMSDRRSIADRDLFFAIVIWSKDRRTIAIAKFNDRDRKNSIFLAIFAAINIGVSHVFHVS